MKIYLFLHFLAFLTIMNTVSFVIFRSFVGIMYIFFNLVNTFITKIYLQFSKELFYIENLCLGGSDETFF